MNKIYKSIYNAVRGVWVVVSEATSSYKQPSKSLLGGGEVLILPTSVKERAIKIAAITACLMLMGDSALCATGLPDNLIYDAAQDIYWPIYV